MTVVFIFFNALIQSPWVAGYTRNVRQWGFLSNIFEFMINLSFWFYYQRFWKDFSKISSLLQQMTSCSLTLSWLVFLKISDDPSLKSVVTFYQVFWNVFESPEVYYCIIRLFWNVFEISSLWQLKDFFFVHYHDLYFWSFMTSPIINLWLYFGMFLNHLKFLIVLECQWCLWNQFIVHFLFLCM